MGRYEIVPGDPREHRDAFLGLCFRNLPASRETSERRYRKYYESNPAGPASFFLARPTGEQDFCGVVASFPARCGSTARSCPPLSTATSRSTRRTGRWGPR